MNEEQVFKEIFTDPALEIQRAKLPFVWEIEHNGVISHLVGTQHEFPADFRDSFADFLCGKRQAALEFTPHDFKENAKLFLPYVEYAAAPCIDSLVEDEQRMLAQLCAAPVNAMRQMPLCELYNLVNEQAAAQAGMLARKIDIDLYKIAAENRMLVHSLEAPQDLAQVMVAMLPQLEKRVRWMARNPANEAAMRELRETTEAYLSGDAGRCLRMRGAYLGQTMQEYCAAHPELVAERNKKMVRNSLELLAEPTLMAVGLMHAITEQDSMPALYRDAGAKVERVQ